MHVYGLRAYLKMLLVYHSTILMSTSSYMFYFVNLVKSLFSDDWKNLEEPYGSIFLSIPTMLDSSLAPKGRHILHIFTTSSIEDWQMMYSLERIL
ncbi:putative prolycopene isomerase [Helianthus annuus]|nr:putative prolycopene isomerase [Helianthus annuus]